LPDGPADEENTMKRNSVTTTAVLAMVLPLCMYAAADQSRDVTAQTLAAQPADKPYTLDLRSGAVYTVSADVASRVLVSTAAGQVKVSDLAKRLGVTGSTLQLVSVSGPTSIPTNLPTAVPFAQCGKTSCSCTGSSTGKDCKDLGNSGLCSQTAAGGITMACGEIGFGKDEGKQGCACIKRQ
jgi:hypothetical protein